MITFAQPPRITAAAVENRKMMAIQTQSIFGAAGSVSAGKLTTSGGGKVGSTTVVAVRKAPTGGHAVVSRSAQKSGRSIQEKLNRHLKAVGKK
jgi:hypothetical protein